jgi:hypothetical protein
MIGGNDQKQIAAALAAISERSREALIKDWRLAHKQSPPKGISRRLLEYSAAFQLQVKAFGGLKPTVRRKLQRLAVSKDKPAKCTQAGRQSKALSPGTRLVREWHGETHTVEVLSQEFAYDGELYNSLSEAARTITGARWSGPRFFGL